MAENHFESKKSVKFSILVALFIEKWDSNSHKHPLDADIYTKCLPKKPGNSVEEGHTIFGS